MGIAWTSPLFRGDPAAFNDANDFMQDDDTGFGCVTEELGRVLGVAA